jgi:predicted amidohydrolase YtcJ
MRPRAFYVAVALVIGAGVSSAQSVDTDFDPSVNFASQTADLILKNGAVFIMDANRSQVTAVAVKDGKIVFVGSDTGAEALRGSSTRVVDLQGQMVLPGLHDSHVHLTDGGLVTLLCSLTGLTTVPQVLDKVVFCAAEHPERTWIFYAPSSQRARPGSR